MRNNDAIKRIFDRYDGMMRTYQLSKEKIYYADIERLIKEGLIEKIRTGYYQWIDYENLSEAFTITHLFPDRILCMDTALFYYGYSDYTPRKWHIAVDKYANRSRFNIEYPFVKPYYFEPTILELGLCTQDIDGNTVRMYDKERIICDCLRYRNKMDREMFNKAIQAFINDPMKNIPWLSKYASSLRVLNTARNLIGVWL